MATEHDDTRGPIVLAVTAATLALCTVFVLLRIASRYFVVKKPGWDDHALIVAWVLAFGTSFAICYGTTKGLGKHQDDIPGYVLVDMKKAAYAFSALYVGALSVSSSPSAETCRTPR
jgi:predicted small secreted protein